jgi:hypothetical protein
MPHHAEIAHHVRGRIRMKIPAAKGDECLLEQIRQALAPIPGVQEITVNPSTGSVIMLYDPDAHGDFHATLHEHGAGGHIAIRRKPPKFEVDRTVEQLEQEAEFLAEHSRVARVLVDFGRDLDQKVKWATGNAVDLKVLVPLGLAVYTFLHIGIEAATPVWLTLGLFALNHFVEMHAHTAALPVAALA